MEMKSWKVYSSNSLMRNVRNAEFEGNAEALLCSSFPFLFPFRSYHSLLYSFPVFRVLFILSSHNPNQPCHCLILIPLIKNCSLSNQNQPFLIRLIELSPIFDKGSFKKQAKFTDYNNDERGKKSSESTKIRNLILKISELEFRSSIDHYKYAALNLVNLQR